MSEIKEIEGSSKVGIKKEHQKDNSRNQKEENIDKILKENKKQEKTYKIKKTTGVRKRPQKRKIRLVIKIICTISALIPFFLICYMSLNLNFFI